MFTKWVLNYCLQQKYIKEFFNKNYNTIRFFYDDLSQKSNRNFDILYLLYKSFISPVFDLPKDTRFLEFKNTFENTNIEELYKNLIKNLDSESISTVNSVIGIFQTIIKNPNKKYFDIFTQKQKNEINNIQNEFTNNVIELNTNCYTWNGYYLPINRFEESVFYSKHQIDKLKNHKLFKNKNILDVGGFIGDSAIVLSPYTNKNVLTFEPLKEHFDLIQKTIELNKTNNIIPYNFALGNKNEKTTINQEGISSSISLPKIYSDSNTEVITTKTLDSFIKENPMEIGLIKVDIEGFEQQFLEGAKETICSQKPSLLISIYHSFDDFFKIKPLIESWNLNYKFKIAKPESKYLYLETLLIAEIED